MGSRCRPGVYSFQKGKKSAANESGNSHLIPRRVAVAVSRVANIYPWFPGVTGRIDPAGELQNSRTRMQISERSGAEQQSNDGGGNVHVAPTQNRIFSMLTVR